MLLVDDNPDSRQILHAVLEYGGAVVSATATARDAVGVLERVRANVVLTDLVLRGDDGYWLVRHLRRQPADHGGGVPVIAMTAADETRDELLAAGFTDHLRKPIVMDRLYRLIGRLVGRPRRR